MPVARIAPVAKAAAIRRHRDGANPEMLGLAGLRGVGQRDSDGRRRGAGEYHVAETKVTCAIHAPRAQSA